MSPNELEERLIQIKESRNFAFEAEEIIDEIRAADEPNIEYVRVLLKFMEANSTLDFGLPGPFVHYIESYGLPAYKSELLASISRYASTNTTVMLNRVINVTEDAEERGKLISIMRKIASSDSEAEGIASRFLQRLE